MNKLSATITDITAADNVILVDLESEGHALSALLIDSDGIPGWLKKGALVTLAIKETEISIATQFSGNISLRNRFSCTVKQIQRGKILSVVELKFGNFTLKSAITTRSVESLQLTECMEVTAMVKANEVSLLKTE